MGSLQIGSDARGKNGVEVVQCRPVGGANDGAVFVRWKQPD